MSFLSHKKSLALTFTKIPPPVPHLEGCGLWILWVEMSSALCFSWSMVLSGEFTMRVTACTVRPCRVWHHPTPQTVNQSCSDFNCPIVFHYAEMDFAFLHWSDTSPWPTGWFKWWIHSQCINYVTLGLILLQNCFVTSVQIVQMDSDELQKVILKIQTGSRE